MNGTFLYVFTSGVCAGVALSFLFGVGLLGASVFLALTIVAFLVCVFSQRRKFLFVPVMCAALVVGIVRADMAIKAQAGQGLERYAGQTVQVEGLVTNDPDRRDKSLRLTVSVSAVDGAEAHGLLLALVGRDVQIAYGDKVALRGKVTLPEAFETDTGHTFDYPGYLTAQGISVQMQYATVLSMASGGVTLQGKLFSLKHVFERSLERLLPEPEGALMEGILLGEKHGIPQNLTNSFIASGLIHMVVLSGYNISIVAEGIFRALVFLPRTLGFTVGSVVMILFALLAGSGAATLRALLMALIALLARYFHRKVIALRALMVAVTGMVLWSPHILLYDPSFILSVLATFGLVTLSPWVEPLLPSFLARVPAIRSIAASTIAVQIFVLPALLYFSGVLSFLALPANVLALPVIPATMLLGFVAGVLGFISPLLGFVPALAADVLLKWILWVATAAAGMPFSTATVPEFSGWILLCAYAPLAWFAIRKYQQSVSLQRSN